jgi:hypothetical protein
VCHPSVTLGGWAGWWGGGGSQAQLTGPAHTPLTGLPTGPAVREPVNRFGSEHEVRGVQNTGRAVDGQKPLTAKDAPIDEGIPPLNEIPVGRMTMR